MGLLIRSRRSTICCAWLSDPALATTTVPISGSADIRSRMRGKLSLLACPVTSAGLAAQPKPFRTSSKPWTVSSLRGGRESPTWPQLSAVRELIPPEWDTTDTPGALGAAL